MTTFCLFILFNYNSTCYLRFFTSFKGFDFFLLFWSLYGIFKCSHIRLHVGDPGSSQSKAKIYFYEGLGLTLFPLSISNSKLNVWYISHIIGTSVYITFPVKRVIAPFPYLRLCFRDSPAVVRNARDAESAPGNTRKATLLTRTAAKYERRRAPLMSLTLTPTLTLSVSLKAQSRCGRRYPLGGGGTQIAVWGTQIVVWGAQITGSLFPGTQR